MKVLKKGQKILLGIQGTNANKAVYAFLLKLKVGDEAIVDKADWKGNVALSHTIHNNSRLKGQFSCRALPDGSGWWVKRIKD